MLVFQCLPHQGAFCDVTSAFRLIIIVLALKRKLDFETHGDAAQGRRNGGA